jgi:colanic acid biosynthesis glycosyl transferase WcaI
LTDSCPVRAANPADLLWQIPWGSKRTAARLKCVPPRAIKVVIAGINYAPEPTGIAPYTTGLAMGLAARGHEILVLTGYPHYPYWKHTDRDSRSRSEQTVDGVRVRRLNHPVPRRLSWAGRAAMEFTFGLQLLTTKWGRPDVVICVSPPLLAAAMSTMRARLSLRRPSIGIVVQDLYTRGAAETKATSGLATRGLRLLESVALRLADGISVIHTGFADDLSSHLGVDIRRIREIRNWTHIKPSDPESSTAFREAHNWSADDLVVMHAGNMGYKQGLENVVAAARLAAQQASPARFVLIGDGNQRASLEAAASDTPRLEILPPVDDELFPSALGAADVLLVNERPGVARMAVPSKLTSYFSAGKPILAATDATGFTASELAASRAGVCIPADRPDLLLSEAVRLATDRELGRQLGDAGLRYCSNLLSQEAALDGYEKWITDLAALRTARTSGAA